MKSTCMENLSDDLLIEIWSRVSCKTAVRCKSISKRFLALISRPQFIQGFIHHHHTLLQHMKEEEDQEKQWHLFVSKGNLLISFFPTLHQNLLSLSPQFLHPDQVTKQDTQRTVILGSSNGLLLCKQNRLYSVCNPVTKHCLQLPSLSPFTQNRLDRAFDGFLCEPYYNYNVEGNPNCIRVTLNHHSRFRVVCIPSFEGTMTELLAGITKSEFEVVIFPSETGQWTTKLVSCPKGFTQGCVVKPAVAHEGKLYFMGNTSIMVYDPFNSEERCDTIDYPIELHQSGIPFRCHVGVSCGNLRISNLCHTNTTLNSPSIMRLSVWELEQEKEWRLVHTTYLPPKETGDCNRPELGPVCIVDLIANVVQVRGFHPYHGDVLFFQCAHRIFVGNLKTNHFDTVGYDVHEFLYQSFPTISHDLPCWPTPLPSTPT